MQNGQKKAFFLLNEIVIVIPNNYRDLNLKYSFSVKVMQRPAFYTTKNEILTLSSFCWRSCIITQMFLSSLISYAKQPKCETCHCNIMFLYLNIRLPCHGKLLYTKIIIKDNNKMT